MNPINIELAEKNLEEWFLEQPEELLPAYYPARGDIPHRERYIRVMHALRPVHSNVEKGALLKSANDWILHLSEKLTDPGTGDPLISLDDLVFSDPLVYLNCHGHEHVRQVMLRATDLLRHSRDLVLSPYEVYMLLCAIQIHDTGNYFGRDGHEASCRLVISDIVSPHIPDTVERNSIEAIARVHGGRFMGERDTISHLPRCRAINAIDVRHRMLAGILRFSDELADDKSRADRLGTDLDSIPDQSRIYHAYSSSLHTVNISQSTNGSQKISLAFEFDHIEAQREYSKFSSTVLLLDEIYDRTLKMERERRYCIRFLRPHLSLDSIRVEISIRHAEDVMLFDDIEYELCESGYPNTPSPGIIHDFVPGLRNGIEEILHLSTQWGLET